jgi:hypothetical protein
LIILRLLKISIRCPKKLLKAFASSLKKAAALTNYDGGFLTSKKM